MFKGINANYKFNQGFTYVKRVKTSGAGGKTSISDDMEYDRMPIAFIPEDVRPKWTPEGYKHDGFAGAVIPSSFFTKYNITPNVNDIIIHPNGTRYRVIGFSDYSLPPHMGVHQLRLKREEYDGT